MSAPIANYLLTNDDLYLMGKGVWYRSYEKLGAHPCNKDGVEGYWFAVWAPDVKSVTRTPPTLSARPPAACGTDLCPAPRRVSSTST